MKSVSDLSLLLASIHPVLVEGEFVFVTTIRVRDLESQDVLGIFHEGEGTTLICSKNYADRAGLNYEGTYRQITLTVYSSLQAVGFLAEVSRALARAGISCNVMSAFYHDHLFVPAPCAPSAMDVLLALSAQKPAEPRDNRMNG